MKQSKAPKGRRSNQVPTDPKHIGPAELAELIAELRRRPEVPIETLTADHGTIEGIIDLLVVKGHATIQEVQEFGDRYQSGVSALVMLCIEKGLFSEDEMNMALAAFHHVIRAYGHGTGVSPTEIFAARHAHLKKLLDVAGGEEGGG